MATSTTLAVSLAVGLALFGITVMLGWISSTYGVSANLLKWLFLPILSYVLTLGINAVIQATSCKTVDITKLASGALTIPVAVFLALLLTLIGFVRAPIESAVPVQYKLKYAGLFAIAFYVFWAGMFGEALAGGLAQACTQV